MPQGPNNPKPCGHHNNHKVAKGKTKNDLTHSLKVHLYQTVDILNSETVKNVLSVQLKKGDNE